MALAAPNQEDRNPYYGRVIYTPGLTIDQPVGILRLDYTDFPFGAAQATRWPSFVVIPQWNQRGQAQFGTFGDGAAVRQLVPNGGPCGSSSTNDPARCVKIVWPLAWSAYDQQNSPLFPVVWQGSLLEGKKDGTGTLYRRNRSYDPQTGRFTQEDPIGLAGGVNLYGFAAGDPVNFSDPFGLCVPVNVCLAVAVGAIGGISQLAANALGGRPLLQDVGSATARGAAFGLTLGLAAPALFSGGGGTTGGVAVAVAGQGIGIAGGAAPKLETLATKFGTSVGDIVNQVLTEGTRMIDKANGGNVNAIIPRLDGASGFIRITLNPEQNRIISAGFQSANMVSNGIRSGRFLPINP